MNIPYYTTFTITYLTPISNQSGDDIFYEEYVLPNDGMIEEDVRQLTFELREYGGALIETTEGILYLNNHNISSIMFKHEEED